MIDKIIFAKVIAASRCCSTAPIIRFHTPSCVLLTQVAPGVLEWRRRAEQLASELQATAADIVALQEVEGARCVCVRVCAAAAGMVCEALYVTCTR
jgi:hypothetical protein